MKMQMELHHTIVRSVTVSSDAMGTLKFEYGGDSATGAIDATLQGHF